MKISLNLFSLFGKKTNTKKITLNDRIKKIVMLNSTGNVSLQRGNYMTKKDINKLRDEMLSHKFA